MLHVDACERRHSPWSGRRPLCRSGRPIPPCRGGGSCRKNRQRSANRGCAARGASRERWGLWWHVSPEAWQASGLPLGGWRTVVVVQLGDVPRVLAVLDNLVVALVPRGHGSEARAREPGQGVQMQAVEGEDDEIGGEGCCEHRHEAGGGNQGGEDRGHGRLGRCCQVQMEATGGGRSRSRSRRRDMCGRRTASRPTGWWALDPLGYRDALGGRAAAAEGHGP